MRRHCRHAREQEKGKAEDVHDEGKRGVNECDIRRPASNVSMWKRQTIRRKSAVLAVVKMRNKEMVCLCT